MLKLKLAVYWIVQGLNAQDICTFISDVKLNQFRYFMHYFYREYTKNTLMRFIFFENTGCSSFCLSVLLTGPILCYFLMLAFLLILSFILL